MGLGLGLGQMFGDQAAIASAAPATATWDSANSSADWTLSGGLLTATRSVVLAAFFALLRATTAKTNGTVTVTIGAIGGGTFTAVGVGTAAEPDSPGNVISGASIGYRSSGGVYQGNALVGTAATFTTGDVIKVTKAGVNVSFYKNTVLQATVDTSDPGNGFGTVLAGNAYPMVGNGNGTGTVVTGDFTSW